MNTSRLSTLPRELRDRIYQHTLAQDAPVTAYLSTSGHLRLHASALGASLGGQCPVAEKHPAAAALLGLPATCKQARAETLGLFFKLNDFRVVCVGLLQDDDDDDEDDDDGAAAAAQAKLPLPHGPFATLNYHFDRALLAEIRRLTVVIETGT